MRTRKNTDGVSVSSWRVCDGVLKRPATDQSREIQFTLAESRQQRCFNLVQAFIVVVLILPVSHKNLICALDILHNTTLF